MYIVIHFTTLPDLAELQLKRKMVHCTCMKCKIQQESILIHHW